jgi:uncharacterized protein YecA (UPF0149 family)
MSITSETAKQIEYSQGDQLPEPSETLLQMASRRVKAMNRRPVKPKRNDPCRCGSGRKY